LKKNLTTKTYNDLRTEQFSPLVCSRLIYISTWARNVVHFKTCLYFGSFQFKIDIAKHKWQ